ncbi:hypothetical protein FQA39_LY02005 [Lamprigera yunnana]|nr:hypothetical protein FQA39_LY02005 [Lamprigera yunnana]
MLTVILIIILMHRVHAEDLSAITDFKTLIELPLQKLIKLKYDFNRGEDSGDEKVSYVYNKGANEPEALALQSTPNLISRGGHDHHSHHSHHHHHPLRHHHGKQKHKKDKSSILHISVTTLSFIAFGGYLLCLIIQAIRAKQAATTTTAMPPGLLFSPIRLYRNGQTNIYTNSKLKNKRLKREATVDWDAEVMYNALIHIAEGYSKYHTIDYKNFNVSKGNFWSYQFNVVITTPEITDLSHYNVPKKEYQNMREKNNKKEIQKLQKIVEKLEKEKKVNNVVMYGLKIGIEAKKEAKGRGRKI